MESLINTVVGVEPWIEMEGKGNSLTFENQMRYMGKWITYGTAEYIEKKAKELEPKLGDILDSLKYSYKPVNLTDRTPPNSCALVVYCSNFARKDARRILESHNIEDVEWVSNICSLKNLIKKPGVQLLMTATNPERLLELGDVAGLDMTSDVEKCNNFFANYKEAMINGMRKYAKEHGMLDEFEKEMKKVEAGEYEE